MKFNNESKRLLITHTDLDGISVYIVAMAMKCEFQEIWSRDYDFDLITENEETKLNPDVMQEFGKFDEIVIADLSLDIKTYEFLKSIGINVMTFDHHESSLSLGEFITSHDQSRSGTQLFFEDYCLKHLGKSRYPSLLRKYVELVSCYDMWKEDDPLFNEALNLNNLINNTKDYDKNFDEGSYNRFLKNCLYKFDEDRTDWFWYTEERNAIEKARENEDKRFTEALGHITVRLDSKGKRFGVIRLPGKISIVCHRILKYTEYKYLDYIIAINNYGGESGKISARSKNFDCTQLAAVQGHTGAAGGMLPKDRIREFFENRTLCLTYLEDDPERKQLIEIVEKQSA